MRCAHHVVLSLLSLLITFTFQTAFADESLYQLREQTTFDVSSLESFNGHPISEIEFEGLRWTRPWAVRALLSLKVGDTFDANAWIDGIHKLYDTTVIYDVKTVATLDTSTRPESVRLHIKLEDRWTLLPFANVQTGGGSANAIVGVQELNVLGSFTQIAASYGQFNGVNQYDLNVFEEFTGGADYIAGLDVSQVGTPIDLQLNDGTSLSNSTLLRTQLQILLGRKWTERRLRVSTYSEFFSDRLIDPPLFAHAQVTNGVQYRLRPILTYGRSELTNFLEEGFEVTVSPVVANFLDSERSYSQLVSTFKRTFIHANTNYAVFLNTGAMTTAEVPYLFHLGGYDTVRGFSTNRVFGRFYGASNLEYRPYLFRVYTLLTGEVVFQGCVFEDTGYMFNANQFALAPGVTSSVRNPDLLLASVGAGLRLNFLRFAGAIVRFDVAQTITPSEGVGVAIGIGQLF